MIARKRIRELTQLRIAKSVESGYHACDTHTQIEDIVAFLDEWCPMIEERIRSINGQVYQKGCGR